MVLKFDFYGFRFTKRKSFVVEVRTTVVIRILVKTGWGVSSVTGKQLICEYMLRA
jgi:hypothetical protein